jgi:hypothetical protein
MRKLETALVFVFLLSAIPTSGQPAKNASVTLGVVTSFGAPLPGGEVQIDGQSVHEVITIKGRTSITLPYGTYRLTSEPSAYYWASERTVDVIAPKTFVLIVFARKEAFAISGEGTPTPYTVSGTVAFAHPRNSKLFVRLRGLYLPSSAEAEIDEKGHFELAVRLQGSYAAEILDGESIAAAKTIRLDETKARPVQVDFIVP